MSVKASALGFVTLLLLLASSVPGWSQTRVYFTNAYSGVDLSQYYLYWQGGYTSYYSTDNWATSNAFTSGGTLSSNQVSVADLISGSGGYITIDYMNAARLNVLWGGQLTNFAAPSVDTSPYSFTYLEGNYSSGAGNFDITYINSFEIPIGGKVYSSTNLGGSVLQSNGYNFAIPTTDAINRFISIQQGGVSNANFVTNSSGNLIRIISGNNGNAVDYPPPSDYFTYLVDNRSNATGQMIIQRSNAISAIQLPTGTTNLLPNGTNYSNFNILPNFTATVHDATTIVMTGSMTYTFWNTGGGINNPDSYSTTFSGISMTVTANNQTNLYNLMIQNPAGFPAGNILPNAEWDTASNWIVSTVGASSVPLVNANIWQIPTGDLFSIIAMGLAGSTVLSPANGNTAVHNLSSGDYWAWAANDIIAYEAAQPDNSNYYNPWSLIVRELATNVYSYVYDDRFKFSPVLLDFNTNQSVLISLGTAVLAVPEPTTAIMVGLGLVGFALYRSLRRKKQA